MCKKWHSDSWNIDNTLLWLHVRPLPLIKYTYLATTGTVGIWDFIRTTEANNLTSFHFSPCRFSISSVGSVRKYFIELHCFIGSTHAVAKDICYGAFIGIQFETAFDHRFNWDKCHNDCACAMFQCFLGKRIHWNYLETNHMSKAHPTSGFQIVGTMRGEFHWISPST